MMFTREELLDALRSGTINVTFTKKDGTNRNMRCTLLEDMVPSDAWPTGESKRKASDDVIAVFDLEKDDWRSFRVDAVTSYSAE